MTTSASACGCCSHSASSTRKRPVAVVIDDLQWVDSSSLRALLFATRRLSAESVVLILIVRDDGWDDLPEGLRKLISGSGGTRMRLGPLSAAELRELASAEGVTLSAAAAEQLCDHTAGHPLYARALLEELPPEAWEAGRTLPAPR